MSHDNPYSETWFRTLNYAPVFPERLGSIGNTRAFMAGFVDAYNHNHHHAGIGVHTRPTCTTTTPLASTSSAQPPWPRPEALTPTASLTPLTRRSSRCPPTPSSTHHAWPNQPLPDSPGLKHLVDFRGVACDYVMWAVMGTGTGTISLMQQVPPPSAHNSSFARSQIHGLTGIRALAALWVVVHHFHQPLYALFPGAQGGHDYIESGFLGVEVFFVLSGFIITYTYADQFERFTMGTYTWFVLLRVARIYPVHLVTLLAVLVLVVAAGLKGLNLDFPQKYTMGNFMANILMLQSVPPFSAWNGPAWSICSEFAAYLAFPLIALWVARIRNARAGLTAAAAVLLGGTALMLLIVAYINPSPTSHELIWLRISTEFTAGALLYAGWRHLGPMRQGPWWGWVAVVAVAGVVVLLGVIGDGSPFVLATVPLIGVFVLACAGATGWLLRLLGSKVMIWGGKVSYSVYMTHFILLMAFGKILPWDAYVDSSLETRLGVMAAYYLMVIIAGASCYYLVEEPARRAIRRTADARAAQPVVVS
ncbi:acyltransferase family protein [Kocuria arenosa]|uniref:acyltransferase family protein n=1 Tax=Kocuria arenosa TaxID=3071446 RepID=UPI0034D74746